ncbi:hypothetical protein [Nocardia cyriacigeorgica]|uniref:hypothetical protein n=2 Tax=Nocardia cyriacigeorgica TaxID=135487 RepID=UPI002454D423|nr:hypothetical protein [Nocardia cyriacigeorgica]
MPSTDRCDYRDPWLATKAFRRKRVMSTVFLAGLAVTCAGIAIQMWRTGDDTAHVVAKYVAVFGLTMLMVVLLGVCTDVELIRRPGSVELRTFEGRAATIVPGSTAYFVAYQLIWVGFAVLFLMAAAETALAAWRTHWPLALLFACLGLGSASAPMLALAGALRRGRVVLTADYIVHEGWSSRTRLPWDDVTRVSAAFEQSPMILIIGTDGQRWSHVVTTPRVPLGRGRRRVWMVDRPARRGSICVECPRISVERRRLYEFLTYYTDHPAARAELGTPLALDRWHATR